MNRLLRFILPILDLNKRRGTIRFMFSAAIPFAAVLSATVIMSSDISYVRLETSKTTVEAGDRLKIDVYANANVPVNAVDITLQFDPVVLDVVSVDRGQSVITIWTEEPIVKDGKVILRGGTYKRGFIGEHMIASLTLVAKGTGLSDFSATDVVLLAGDGKGTPVAVGQTNDSTVSLYIYDENTTLDSIGVDVTVKIVTDIDGDGIVSLKDVSAFMVAWNDEKLSYDFNGDGKMTFKDFSILLADFFFN